MKIVDRVSDESKHRVLIKFYSPMTFFRESVSFDFSFSSDFLWLNFDKFANPYVS